MGCITGFLLLCNIGLVIAADVLLWGYSALMGLFGLVGVAVFFIAYALSVELAIAPRDFWLNPSFGIFIKKLVFANTAALMAWGGTVIVAALLGNEGALEFVGWLSE